MSKAIALVILCLLASREAMASSASVSVDGALYTMDYTSPAPGDYLFNLHIDLTGYTGGGSFLDALAFKAGSSFSNFTLLNAPDGTANWQAVPGGLNAQGCNGSGAGFECINGLANSGKGYNIQPLSSNVLFSFEFQGVTLSSTGVTVKAEYVNAAGTKMGTLVSNDISPTPLSQVATVAEPGPVYQMIAGLGLLGMLSSRKRPSATRSAAPIP